MGSRRMGPGLASLPERGVFQVCSWCRRGQTALSFQRQETFSVWEDCAGSVLLWGRTLGSLSPRLSGVMPVRTREGLAACGSAFPPGHVPRSGIPGSPGCVRVCVCVRERETEGGKEVLVPQSHSYCLVIREE